MTAVFAPVVVGASADLVVGEGRAYAVAERQIAVFRMTDGSLRAADAVCPHNGGPLADGQFDPVAVVCPLHQYAFRFADGGCATEGIGAVSVYEAADREGEIVVWC
ncbi:Rieske 2Fe-2S domain-containing protein [Gordonia sp. ABSL1-1]|uniref:Rieske (2Fe-2S) protein n=1 Tax=Gordonia sp. ABSL1-1 TaxID=3053923 RepID=UPI0025741C82|nr:Rieske 2Fe-2S domain-containing protein [Gordonia sp. ABSL1-1]MDL9939022.1 Rieske 2Fe-2S domain-containing protein [Gordonia sp. ABSL1-1]